MPRYYDIDHGISRGPQYGYVMREDGEVVARFTEFRFADALKKSLDEPGPKVALADVLGLAAMYLEGRPPAVDVFLAKVREAAK